MSINPIRIQQTSFVTGIHHPNTKFVFLTNLTLVEITDGSEKLVPSLLAMDTRLPNVAGNGQSISTALVPFQEFPQNLNVTWMDGLWLPISTLLNVQDTIIVDGNPTLLDSLGNKRCRGSLNVWVGNRQVHNRITQPTRRRWTSLSRWTGLWRLNNRRNRWLFRHWISNNSTSLCLRFNRLTQIPLTRQLQLTLRLNRCSCFGNRWWWNRRINTYWFNSNRNNWLSRALCSCWCLWWGNRSWYTRTTRTTTPLRNRSHLNSHNRFVFSINFVPNPLSPIQTRLTRWCSFRVMPTLIHFPGKFLGSCSFLPSTLAARHMMQVRYKSMIPKQPVVEDKEEKRCRQWAQGRTATRKNGETRQWQAERAKRRKDTDRALRLITKILLGNQQPQGRQVVWLEPNHKVWKVACCYQKISKLNSNQVTYVHWW